MQRLDWRDSVLPGSAIVRRWTLVFLVLAWGVSGAPSIAQQAPVPEVSFPIVVSTDAGPTQTLTLGYDPAATDGTEMDELDAFDTDAPPPAPSGTFDAWLSQDRLYGEIRTGQQGFDGEEEHRVGFQTQGEATEVTISWNLPDGISGTIEDEFGGGSYGPTSMSGEGSITISPDAPNAMVTLDYSGSQASINIHPVFVRENGIVNFRNTGVDIDFSGVGTPGTVTLTKYRNGPGDSEGIDESNVSEYRYVVEPGDLSFSSTTVQFADSTLAGMEDPSAVQVYRRATPGGGPFEAVPTDVSGDGEEVLATTDAFGEFVLASDSDPLPVELVDFSARRDGRTALLRWQTAQETNSAGFEVQHRTPEATRYAEVGFVDSAAPSGSTSKATSYRFEVPTLQPGTHQFRLRQVDTDGTGHFSAPVSLTVEMTQALHLSPPAPNPVQASARLRFGVQTASETSLELFNVLGQRVATLYEGRSAGGEMHTIDLDTQTLSALPSGIYFVRLEAGGESRTQRLTIAR